MMVHQIVDSPTAISPNVCSLNQPLNKKIANQYWTQPNPPKYVTPS